MKFFKLLTYDLKNVFLLGFVKLLIIMGFTLAFCLDFYLSKDRTYMLDASIPYGTFIDYVFYIFAGMKEYIPSQTEAFTFPVKWLLIYLFIFYSTLHYPYRDLSSFGVNVLVRTNSRTAWWISKSIWNICYVLTIYVVIFLTVAIFCLVMQEPITIQLTPMFVNDLLEAGSPYDDYSNRLILIILFLPILITIGLNLLQMTLVLFIKPLYSFGVLAIIILSSAYMLNSYLPGNYLMPIRSEHVVENGVTAYGGVLMSFIIIAISFVIGCLYFQRYDILEEE